MSECSIDVEPALDVRASTGESPTWSQREHVLYWVDIEEPALHRFDPASGHDERWAMPAAIGAFALCRSGRILAALRTGLVQFALDAPGFQTLAAPPYDPRTHRFNEGKCDAAGRFWVGTMYQPLDERTTGAITRALPLHVYSVRNGLQPVDARAQTANGLAWSLDNCTLYFADTKERAIRRFDFDATAGTIGAPRLWRQFSDPKQRPDGAAIDSEGGYWCALYGAGLIVRLDANGEVEREIELPVSQPTMCAFGGHELDTLYITSAARGLDAAALQREPLAGALLRCRPGVRGMPAHLFAD